MIHEVLMYCDCICIMKKIWSMDEFMNIDGWVDETIN